MTGGFERWEFPRGPFREEWEGIVWVDNPGEWRGFQKRWKFLRLPLTWWRLAGQGLR